jgi:CheY-like chemotaxis protein
MTETDRQFTPQNGYTVLIVDDNPVQTAVRQAILRRAGYFVLAALNPVRALEMVDDKRLPAQISAVITDHVMPGMIGSKFVRELRKARPHLPVFVVSGLEEAEDEYAGLNAHFLLKPLPPDLLLSSLRNLLEAAEGDAA